MLNKPKHSSVCAVLLFLLASCFRVALASQDVNPNDPINGLPLTARESLEIISASGCMPSLVQGDYIKAEREIGRLLVESEECIDKEENRELYAAVVWKYLKTQYSYEFDVARQGKKARHAWNKVNFQRPLLTLDQVVFQQDKRWEPAPLTAFVSPWTAYKEGYKYEGGYNAILSGKAGLSVGSWFDVSAEPYAVFQNPKWYGGNLHGGYMKFTTGNFELKFGRSPMYWGQGRGETVIFSGNGTPIEMAQIGNPSPTILPWIFKYFGPFQYRLFFGVLDKNHNYRYPFLLGGRIMMKPLSNLEFGLSRIVAFGGEGAQHYDFWEPPAELLGLRIKDGFIFHIKVSDTHNTENNLNNLSSIDFRWRIPALRNMEIYTELYIEDPLVFEQIFTEDAILHGGINIPRLNDAGDLQLFLKGAYAARIPYTHSSYTSGFQNGYRFMGMDQGKFSIMASGEIVKIFNRRAKISAASTYLLYRDPDEGRGVAEERYVFSLYSDWMLDENFHLIVGGGDQQIYNYDFGDTDKNSLFGEVKLEYRF